MSKFSDESRLLIRNYDSYKDILDAGDRLKSELKALLPVIAKRLRNQEWFKSKWAMEDPQDTPDSIQLSFWEGEDDGRLIWVLVENLNPDAIFGNKQPPFMSVWIFLKAPALKSELKRIIQTSGKAVMGEWDTSQNSQTVVSKRLSKCLTEDIDSLEESILTQFSEFIKFYQQFSGEFNKAVEKHLKASK